MDIRTLLVILKRYLQGTSSDEEKKSVDTWYDSVNDHRINFPEQNNFPSIGKQIYEKVLGEIGSDFSSRPFYKTSAFRIAASVILLLGVSLFLYVRNFKNKKPEDGNVVKVLIHDVAPPKTNKAVLTLADGTKIDLDSSKNGMLAVQGNVHVIKKENGQIEYNGNTTANTYNTLYVPRGSKPINMRLADGTVVWLNAESSISYPVAFSGSRREVQIAGEAYFEVAKNPLMPFTVKKLNSNTEIRVLGTHFNVNAYDDEDKVKVTLLKGSVQVFDNKSTGILTPGEQAKIQKGTITVLKNVNLDEVMAWKNGRFYFDGADLKTIMRQVEKWYDVDIQFQDAISASFVAKISRDVNVSELLQIFESTGLVHFKVGGRLIKIMK